MRYAVLLLAALLFLPIQIPAAAQTAATAKTKVFEGNIDRISAASIVIKLKKGSRVFVYRFHIVRDTVITGTPVKGARVKIEYRIKRRPSGREKRIASRITVIE